MKKLTVGIIIGLFGVSLLLSGCSLGIEEEITFYKGPIDGWEDIAVPEGAVFSQPSVIGGVENHFFKIPGLTEGEFFSFIEEAMAVNGWTLNATSGEIRQFIKNDDVITYNSNGVTEDAFYFVVIIEPKGIYGDD